MTDNLKIFLEAVSQDREFIEKLKKVETPEAVIALAAEKGFTLTAEDLKSQTASGEVSDDELDAVAGGGACACIFGGGGEPGVKDYTCACVAAGIGNYLALDENNVGYEEMRCACPAVGGGTSKG